MVVASDGSTSGVCPCFSLTSINCTCTPPSKVYGIPFEQARQEHKICLLRLPRSSWSKLGPNHGPWPVPKNDGKVQGLGSLQVLDSPLLFSHLCFTETMIQQESNQNIRRKQPTCVIRIYEADGFVIRNQNSTQFDWLYNRMWTSCFRSNIQEARDWRSCKNIPSLECALTLYRFYCAGDRRKWRYQLHANKRSQEGPRPRPRSDKSSSDY